MSKPRPIVTPEQIRSLVETGIEPAEPQTAILGYLRAHDGKKLTKRDLPGLAKVANDPGIMIRTVAGMTNIETSDYRRSDGGRGVSLLIAYALGAVTIDAAWVEERNACYFSARERRNEARAKVLADPSTPNTSNAFAELAEAINTLNRARATIEALTEYGAPLYEIRHEVAKLYKDDKR